MKSLAKDESLSMLNQSSVFENLLTVYSNVFGKLKEALNNAQVLAYPNFNKPFKLETHASLSGLGVVLMKRITIALVESLLMPVIPFTKINRQCVTTALQNGKC